MPTQQSELFTITFIAAAFIAVMLVYFIYVIVQQKNKIFSWQEARIKAEVETLENERRRIAGELHDDIGPLLSAIKLLVTHVEPSSDDEAVVIKKASNHIDDVIQRFRDIAYNLLPTTLIRKGLVNAIEEFIAKMNDAHAVRIYFEHDVAVRMSSQNELNLYRIVQEITHNTIKHSHATELILTLHTKNKDILFSAKDNGSGFVYTPAVPAGNGLGLLNIQSRISLLNGKLYITTERNKGTHFLISIPVPSND